MQPPDGTLALVASEEAVCLMADEAEKLAVFKAVSGTDDDGFAISFLEAHDWNVETAVHSLMGGSATAAGGSPSMPPSMLPDEPTDPLLDRAPMSQYKDTLMDPAQRMPTTPAAPVTHRLEAFRDAKTDSVEARGEDARHDPRRPKTLADIYRRPAEICFNGKAAPPPTPTLALPPPSADTPLPPHAGSFDELRQAGRAQGRWLLVNIQSPTECAAHATDPPTSPDPPPESLPARPLRACQPSAVWEQRVPCPLHGRFASQQLNADTWGDEMLRIIVSASFLFWQQYFDDDLVSEP